MSSNFKTAPASHPEPVRGGNFYRLAIVGAGSLKGKEVAEVLNDRNFPSIDVKLLDDEEALGKLEAVGDEVTFIQNVRTEQFQNIDFTFFASDPESTRKNWKTAHNAGSAIIDLTSALEDEPDATVRSPWIERQLGQALIPQLQPGPAVVAHPAAVVLALLLLRVQKAASVKLAVATVFEPASEHGQKGMDELHEQTVNLLSQNCWQRGSAAIADVGAGSHLSRTRLCDPCRTRAARGCRKHFASARRRTCETHAWS
jgi:aspartate-semialdehyde dehydrogenase